MQLDVVGSRCLDVSTLALARERATISGHSHPDSAPPVLSVALTSLMMAFYAPFLVTLSKHCNIQSPGT